MDIEDVTTALGLVHQVLKSDPPPCLRHHECRITVNLLTGAYQQLSALAQRGIVRTSTGNSAKLPHLEPNLQDYNDILNPTLRTKSSNLHGQDSRNGNRNNPGPLAEEEWAVALSEATRQESPAAHSKKLGKGVKEYVNKQMD